MTQADARKALAAIGCTLRRLDCGEYRVNYRGGAESTAYYTDDLRDALDTGAAMVAQRANG